MQNLQNPITIRIRKKNADSKKAKQANKELKEQRARRFFLRVI
jgi:hypothetical protein